MAYVHHTHKVAGCLLLERYSFQIWVVKYREIRRSILIQTEFQKNEGKEGSFVG